MGVAEQWQERLAAMLSDLDVTLLNPRRDNWDPSWEQSIDNPQFNEQVTWELDGLDSAHIVVFYFDPATKSPVTLLELGYVSSKSCAIVVCCPDGFWRKGNVDILCARKGITVVSTLEDVAKETKNLVDIVKWR